MSIGRDTALRFAVTIFAYIAVAAVAQERVSVAPIPATVTNDSVLQRDSEIVVQAIFRGDKYVGYRIYPGRDHEAFERIGFLSGDLITAINGKSLANRQPMAATLKTLCPTADSIVEISLERNGEPMILKPQCQKL